MKSKIKNACFRLARSVGVLRAADKLAAGSVRILCYHGVWRLNDDFPGDAMFIRKETFERRLDLLQENGYRVVSLEAAAAALSGAAEPLERAVVITIDDGWLGTYEDMLPALLARDMSATLYCDTRNLLDGTPIAHVCARYLRDRSHPADASQSAEAAYAAATDLSRPLAERWAALQDYAPAIGVDLPSVIASGTFSYMRPEQLRDAAERGLDIQLHTHTHDLGDFSQARVAAELEQNRAALGEILGDAAPKLRHFCYPSGQYAPSVFAHLAEADVLSATTCEMRLATRADSPHALPRILDNGAMTEVEFLAELAGVGARLRRLAA